MIERLPPVRGRYTPMADLKPFVWFRVGGPAEVLFKPKDVEDLQNFLQNKPQDIPHTIIGVGSNLLIRDGGLPGVTIRLGAAFAQMEEGENTLKVGAAALDRTVALKAASLGRGGLSFLAGIPGTIGGAVKMNAGAYGHEVKDTFTTCMVLTPAGELEERQRDQMGFRYRKSNLREGEIVISATFETAPEKPEVLQGEIQRIMTERELTQPTRARTGGSTFKNPPGQKAWELIDHAGCRGYAIGDAIVSEKHCNFLINTGNASAEDLEKLGNHVQEQVLKNSQIALEWEIKRLGHKKDS